jgi:hypothetical protein
MNFKEELAKMQSCYDQKRLQDICLKKPQWLALDDPMASVFQDKSVLLKHGNVCFAYIVQANTILFKHFPHVDCPAHIVYSTDACIADDPGILQEISHQLYRYKHTPLKNVPEQWREIVRVIADEYDRSDFTFSVECRGNSVEIHFIPTMIFRKLLPNRKLCGSLLPILAAPECKSVMILPKGFWTKDFRHRWTRGAI